MRGNGRSEIASSTSKSPILQNEKPAPIRVGITKFTELTEEPARYSCPKYRLKLRTLYGREKMPVSLSDLLGRVASPGNDQSLVDVLPPALTRASLHAALKKAESQPLHSKPVAEYPSRVVQMNLERVDGVCFQRAWGELALETSDRVLGAKVRCLWRPVARVFRRTGRTRAGRHRAESRDRPVR
jgi:hypothetical protein